MILTRRGFLAGSGAALCATALQATTPDLLQIEGPAFGARWRVRAAMGTDAAAVARAMMRVIETIDAAMSPFRAGSEISAFNRAETTDWLPLSPVALTTVAEAHRIAAQTQGAFDPTFGGLTGRYGFGPITGTPEGAFQDLALGSDCARKAHARQTLDLCGIAKGHALDQCAEALRSRGLETFFIELGGEVTASGLKPDTSPWRAAIERPLSGPSASHCVVSLRSEALATSGDLINSYVLAGHRYSHIIDPRRMAPSDSALASVSVFAPRAITADALATALFAMGPENGPAFAEQAAVDALFLSRDGTGLREVMTGRFADRIVVG
ncbi:FAD:protein FMN transferase [Puniceibacterium confluentis]|uniref:FAD:protein FMN transferase n=1 Tax=Puniceibacterium confluentis TaxID=1958944 RepID=UPI0011B7C296|nr:FAD:protein FMN transferase [Puniceibacterium confluentis]